MIADIIPLQHWICWANTLLEITLITRMFWLRLWKRYKAFLIFLACDATRDLFLCEYADLGNYTGSPSYAFWWAVTAPALWITLALAVLELFRRIYQSFRGDPHASTLLTVALLSGASTSLGISLTMMDRFSAIGGWQDAARVASRTIWFMGTTTLLVQHGYLCIAKVKLPHNVTVHRVAFTVCLCAESTLRYVTALKDAQVAAYANVAAAMSFTVALLIWLFGFRRGGEESGPPPQKTQTEMERATRNYERMKRYLNDLSGRR
jgi:hypothetical protein